MQSRYIPDQCLVVLQDATKPLPPIWAAQQILKDKLSNILKGDHNIPVGGLSGPQYLRVETKTSNTLDLISWLRAQSPHGPRVFFRALDRRRAAAGAGAARLVAGAGELTSEGLRPGVGGDPAAAGGLPPWARFVGGERFDPETLPAEEWQAFGGHFYVLPMVEFSYEEGQDTQGKAEERKVLAVNLYWGDSEENNLIRAIMNALEYLEYAGDFHRRASAKLPAAVAARSSVGAAEWERAVREVLAEIEAGRVKKVVLARNCEYEFLEAVCPLDLLARFEGHRGYLFLLEPGPSPLPGRRGPRGGRRPAGGGRGPAFVGCTPEQLFKVDGDRVTADSIAGTRPRGADAAEDLRLEQELWDSQKDQTENSLTAEHITQVLSSLACDVRQAPPTILKLAHVQHIAKQIEVGGAMVWVRAPPAAASTDEEGHKYY